VRCLVHPQAHSLHHTFLDASWCGVPPLFTVKKL
jgi:hypothetical protein